MDLRFDKDTNLAYIRLTGMLTKDLILAAFDAAVYDDGYASGMGRIWDFREADLSLLNPPTIASIARYPTRFPPGINDVKVAFVCGRELEYGLSRMFEALSADGDTKISVFYSMEEAETWMAGGQAP